MKKKEKNKEPTKEQILKNIEAGAKTAAAFIKARKKLKEAKNLFRG